MGSDNRGRWEAEELARLRAERDAALAMVREMLKRTEALWRCREYTFGTQCPEVSSHEVYGGHYPVGMCKEHADRAEKEDPKDFEAVECWQDVDVYRRARALLGE